ncbi:MAG: acetolactate synthase small subunit [gamma proteobacterium endosymbiont of Lamellibrachia anaximandri]|nr:acetolactate synthase small subunit [gamma proteobacterium endosymbiont of Lamellibrachia anaximandri]
MSKTNIVRQVISVISLNEESALSRISSLFAARGYNIDSLTVAAIPDSKYSRFTIVSHGDSEKLKQIILQLSKLIPVHKVFKSSELLVEKEVVLVKIPLNKELGGLESILRSYHGEVANSGKDYLVLMAADDSSRINEFIESIEIFKPISVVRSGSVAI